MNVGSLFSGIGGLDLGLESAGMTVRWQSEIDPYCCRVLAKHWPDVPNLGDVTTIDWSTVEPVDLICGGYPCQPFSLAGARQGETDVRHLWPRFADAIRHLRPRYALLENVPGHLSLGFGRVLGDLAELGYDTEWDCIPAAALGAPHLRYRIFVVAYPTRAGRVEQRGTVATPTPLAAAERGRAVPDAERDELRHQPVNVGWSSGTAVTRDDGTNGIVADTNGRGQSRVEEAGRQWRQVHGDEQRFVHADRRGPLVADTNSTTGSEPWSAGKAVPRSGTLERSGRRCGSERDHWSVEPDVGRVAHGVPNRVDRLRALGNAVVPQVAEWIGHRIMAAAA